jgi:hypothetical protein
MTDAKVITSSHLALQSKPSSTLLMRKRRINCSIFEADKMRSILNTYMGLTVLFTLMLWVFFSVSPDNKMDHDW